MNLLRNYLHVLINDSVKVAKKSSMFLLNYIESIKLSIFMFANKWKTKHHLSVFS